MGRRKALQTKSVRKIKRVVRLITITKKIKTAGDFYVRLGETVRNLRVKAELTQVEAAQLLGYSRPTLANIETGRQRIYAHDILTFSKVLKVSPMRLLKAAKVRP